MADFKAIETFMWVVTLGSFRGAAQKLHTTQPAISQRIAQLEREVGVRLLQRDRRMVLPTPSGRQMMVYAEKLIGLRSEMLAAVGDRSAMHGVLRLGVAETIVHTWLSQLIKRVNHAYPNLSLEIEVDITSNLRTRLLAQEIELAFLLGPLTAPTISNRALCDYPVGFLASPSLGLGKRNLTVHDLAKFPIITFPRKTPPYELVRSLFNRPDLPPMRLHASASLATVIHMAIEGLGIAVIPTAIVENEMADGRLQLLSTNLQMPLLTFSASWLTSPDTVAVERVAELAASLARGAAVLTRRCRRVIETDRVRGSLSSGNSSMTKIASNLQIDSARLWDTIHETAKFGATPKGGVRRLTLGPEDKQVRDWFRSACEAAGLEVHVDALGSMFALRNGRDMSKPPVGLGSHLDTQPTGGKFDGVLGTLAALEVVRTLNDAGIETETPICIVNWTNEEGSRFAPATMASAAYAGDYTTDDILSRKDSAGISVGEALDGIGYRGDETVGARKLGAFVELHIEQGPLLEAENKTIGVVDRGQGIVWYDGKVTGFESHAGTTPMPLRRDALATLAEIVLAVERIAKAHGPNAVGTVGEAVIAAPSRNVIPGEIAFTVDIRSPSAETLEAIDRDLRSAIVEIGPRRKAEIAFDAIWRKPPTVFNAKLVDAVENATKALGYNHRRITSGAGHDACNLANVVPSAMIFVPCKDGVSHNELEDATQADCTAGANALMHTVLAIAGVAS